jgi:hypothetical protein
MLQPYEYQVVFYVSPRGQCFIDEFLDDLQHKPRSKVEARIRQLLFKGPNLPRPYADMLIDGIRELRVQFGNLRIRLFYFIHDKTIVLTHGILKKTGPIPTVEIERAIRLREDWLETKRKGELN